MNAVHTFLLYFSILILFSNLRLRLTDGLLTSDFLTKILYAFLITATYMIPRYVKCFTYCFPHVVKIHMDVPLCILYKGAEFWQSLGGSLVCGVQ